MNDALVAVGIGNTTINFGVCAPPFALRRGDANGAAWNWTRLFTVETANFDPAEIAMKIPTSVTWRVASVHRPAEQRLADWVQRSNTRVSYRNLTAQDLPIKVCVEHPQRVGMDRLVAAVAVNQLRDPQLPAIIVDAGTAITVDLVNRQGDFLGGAILPGMRLVSQALAAKTDQLPQVDPHFHDSAPAPLGRTTEEAIRSGLFWGSVGAIRELIERIGDESGPSQVFVTGGDAERLHTTWPKAPSSFPTWSWEGFWRPFLPDLIQTRFSIRPRRPK